MFTLSFFRIAFLIALFSVTTTAIAKDCPSPLDNWSPAEQFAWRKICENTLADLSGAEARKETGLAPNEKAEISGAFLETILFDPGFSSHVGREGVRIGNAVFNNTVDLKYGKIKPRLFITRSIFAKDLDLSNIELEGSLTILNSTIEGELDMASAKVDGSVFLRNIQANQLTLRGLNVAQQLSLSDSKITSNTTLNSSVIGSSLIARRATFAGFNIEAAQIGLTMDMSGSTFGKLLEMGRIYVENDIRLSTDKRMVSGETLETTASFRNGIKLVFADINGLDLSGSKIAGVVDLSGADIDGDLKLGSANDASTRWEPSSSLILRNTKTVAIQDKLDADGVDSWPSNLDLHGFKYEFLGGWNPEEPTGNGHFIDRGTDWMKGWIARDKVYSPQPYEQLASVLRSYGKNSEAEEIAYIGRDEARSELSGLAWAWQSLLKITIGYGHKDFRAIIGFAILVAIGTIWLHRSGETESHGEIRPGLIYSIDLALPIIQLRNAHYELDLKNDYVRRYFYFHITAGYILITFVVAGLTGLTE